MPLSAIKVIIWFACNGFTCSRRSQFFQCTGNFFLFSYLFFDAMNLGCWKVKCGECCLLKVNLTFCMTSGRLLMWLWMIVNRSKKLAKFWWWDINQRDKNLEEECWWESVRIGVRQHFFPSIIISTKQWIWNLFYSFPFFHSESRKPKTAYLSFPFQWSDSAGHWYYAKTTRELG